MEERKNINSRLSAFKGSIVRDIQGLITVKKNGIIVIHFV